MPVTEFIEFEPPQQRINVLFSRLPYSRDNVLFDTGPHGDGMQAGCSFSEMAFLQDGSIGVMLDVADLWSSGSRYRVRAWDTGSERTLMKGTGPGQGYDLGGYGVPEAVMVGGIQDEAGMWHDSLNTLQETLQLDYMPNDELEYLQVPFIVDMSHFCAKMEWYTRNSYSAPGEWQFSYYFYYRDGERWAKIPRADSYDGGIDTILGNGDLLIRTSERDWPDPIVYYVNRYRFSN